MRFILLFFFCFIVGLASAQIQWEEKLLGGPFGGEIYDIEVYNGSSPAKIFLISNDNAYKSEDNGGSWTKINLNANFTDFEIVGTTVYLLANNKLYHSPDGNSFTQLSVGSTFNNAQRIKKVPGGGFVLTDFNSIFYSATGVSWTEGYAPGTGSIYNRHLEVNDDGQIFIIKDLGPYRSSDGGITFTLVATGIGELVYSLGATNDGSQVFAVSSAKIYSSADGGSWTSIKGGSISDATIVNVSIHEKSFLEFSADGTTMFFFDNENKKLHRKTVAGAAGTWALRASSFPSNLLPVSCASANTVDALAFGTEGGVYLSSTGGSSYSESNTGITEVIPSYPKGLYVDPYNNMFIPGGYAGLFKGSLSTSWTRVATVPPPVFSFSVSAEGDGLYAISGSTIYRSTDKGGSWSALTLPASSSARWVGAATNTKVFAMTSNHDPANFYYSKNGGTTWNASVVNITGLPADYYIFENEIFVASPALLFLQLDNYSNSTTEFYRIDITYNGSNDITSAVATKITTQPLANIERFLAQDGSIYVYSRFTDQLAISTNGGTNWTTLSTPVGDGDFFKADNGYLFLADDQQNKIHISRDEGVTWQQTDWTPTTDLYYSQSIEVSGDIGVVVFSGANYHRSTSTIVTPIAPSGLTAVGIEANSVALRWQDNSNNEDMFVIERSTNGVDFIQVGTATHFSSCFSNAYFTDTQVDGDVDYVYRVVASNTAGNVSSGTFPVLTLPGCTYTMPDNRSWTQGLTTDINIKSLGNGTYQISDLLGDGTDQLATFKESCNETYLVTDDNNNFQANGNGTWNGTTLTLLLRECDTDGTTTETFTLNALDPIPTIPTNVQALIYSNTQVEVNWMAGFFEKTYIIERSLSSGSGFSQVGTVDYPLTSFTDNGPLTLGTTYYYRVKSVNGNVIPLESGYSTVASVQFGIPNFVVSDNAISNYKAFALGSQWADFNNDGRQDYTTVALNVTTEKPEITLFKNLGNGSFEKIVPILGSDNFNFFSISIVDYDNDGFADISIGLEESSGVYIFEGNGDFTFNLISLSALGDLEEEALSGLSETRISWADINRDGLLDLFLWSSTSNRLYKQNADHTFTLITGGDLNSDTERTNVALWSDYNNDGFQDLLLTNGESAGPVRLYKNDGDETFSSTAFAVSNAGNGAWGDYNNDGFSDLYLSVEGENALYRNNGNETFTKEPTTTVSSLTGDPFFGGSFWGDFNNDGYLDLFIYPTGGQTQVLLRNPSGGGVAFTIVLNEKINDNSIVHYSGASVDFNEDGFLDVSLSSVEFSENGDTFYETNNILFENNNTTGKWSLIKLKPGSGNNKDANGAKVRVATSNGSYYREVTTLSSLISRNSNVAHFGLDAATTINEIEVTWPNGTVQTYQNPPISQVITIAEDFQGPTISSHTPDADATQVSTNTSISITLNEGATAVGGKNILLTEVGQSTPAVTLDAGDAVASGNTFTYTLSTSLGQNKQYQVTIDAGAFEDVYGNESAVLAAGAWTFTTSSGPQVASQLPAHNATNVNSNTKLELTFDGVTQAVAGKLISVFAGASTTPSFTFDAGDALLTDNTQSFTPPANLDRDTQYRITVEAGAFVDGGGSSFAGIPDGLWSFTTSPGPKVVTLTPNDGATNANANATLAIEFDKAATPVDGKSLRVYLAGVATPFAEVALTSGTASSLNKKYTYTLPQKLPGQSNFSVIVDALSFADANGNLFIGVGNGEWDFQTVQGPVVSAFSPAIGSADVAINSTVVLTFDKNIIAVAGKKIKVLDGPGSILVDADVFTTGTVATNKYTLPAPAEGWPHQTVLAVQLDEGAFVDANLNDASGITGVQYTFTTVEAPDTQAPVFSFTPPPSYDKGFGTQTVSVEITDNKGVTGARLFHRAISGTTFTELGGDPKANNRWEFTVAETAFDANGLQYYLAAIDAAGNEVRDPATGFHKTTLKYVSEIEVTTALGFGGKKTDWKIFAMPFAGTGSITSVFDELEDLTVKEGYRIVTYSPTPSPGGSWTDYPSFTSFTRGQGYFVNIKDPGLVTLSAGLTAPGDTKDNLFKINLRQGWNQVGNPYLTPISWSDVAAYNGLSEQAAELVVYNGIRYIDATTLAPFAGGFVFMPEAVNNVSIPFLGQTSGGRMKEISWGEGDWSLPLVLSQGEAINDFAGIGMHSEANPSFDDLDRVHVPRFLDFAEVNFDHPEHFARRFARDVVPVQDEFTWNFTVESNQEGVATLQWDASGLSDELFLFDEALQQPIDMRQTSSYSFDPALSSNFKIYYGEKAKESMRSNRVVLSSAFPNPATSLVNIPFSLPPRNGKFSVQLDVFDLMGRKVGTLIDTELNAGFHHVEWLTTGTEAEGIYTIRLSVTAEGRSEVVSGKVMLRK